MNQTSRRALSLVLAAAAASLAAIGCAPGSAGDLGEEQLDKEHAAFSSSNSTVGDWSALPSGVECLVGMQVFYPAKFGVHIPIAPESYSGDCAPEGACHLWLDAQPDPGTWERISSGTPSTYDLIVYPPIGNDPWGHVAAVDHVEDGKIYVMDDNYVAHHVRSSTPHTVDWPAYGWYHLRSLPKDGGDTGGGVAGGGGGGDADNGSCQGLYDGLYCGGDYVRGDAATLYRCAGGKRLVEATCGSGCQVMPDGSNDVCF